MKRKRRFDPDSVRRMKTESRGDLAVGGAGLATHAFTAGLVDECHLFICPVILGRGKPSLSSDLRATLELLDECRFDSGAVYVRYGLPV
jgi:dihydrofolate reductase